MSLVTTIPPGASLEQAQSLIAEGQEVTATGAPKQDALSVTLDASALGFLVVLLIFAVHFMRQPALDLFIVVIPGLLLIRNDYLNFLKLGPGGTPSTLDGYILLQWYRAFRLRDPYTPPCREPGMHPAEGLLGQQPLSCRPGPRPIVAGLAPQRQLTQSGSPQICERLKAALVNLARRQPNRFTVATSTIEKHGFALYARYPANMRGRGEVVHIHDTDKSMHLNLHPDDIKEVLQKG
jgi:hypothetical protein